jgi:hypothetical protein
MIIPHHRLCILYDYSLNKNLFQGKKARGTAQAIARLVGKSGDVKRNRFTVPSADRL